MAKKSKLLQSLGEMMKDKNINDVNELEIDVLKEITICMREVTDYRADTSYQALENIIMIVFIAILCDCDEWEEIYQFGVIHQNWFEKFLNLEYGIPSISTIRKTMAIIDPNELEEVCVNLIISKVTAMEMILNSIIEIEIENEIINKIIEENIKTNVELNTSEKDIIAYDGKTCNGSKRINTKNGKVKPVNAMSAFNVTKDICLATKFIDEKTNEIPTGPELIKMLDLTNTISTFDALNTQEKTIEAIVDKGGNYVAAVKGNQKLLYKDIKDFFENDKLYNEAMEEAFVETIERSHNQTEKRTYIMTSKIDWLADKSKWKNIKSIGIAKREYKKDNKDKVDIRYYITDLSSSEINDFKNAVRDEWGIENNLHWHLDYTFKEDYNWTMNKNAQANLNILRKLSLNLLKLVKPFYNKSLKMIRFILGQNFENEICKVFLCLNIEKLKKITEKNQ